jgi:hypothetical protein
MNIKWRKLLRLGMMLLAGAVAVYLLMHIQ